MSVNENKHNHYLHITIIALIIINIAVNVISMRSAENIEIMKVGGSENYEKLQVIMKSDAYREQYAQNLELMLQQVQGSGNNEVFPAQNPTTEEEITTGSQEILSGETNTDTIVDTNTTQGDQ